MYSFISPVCPQHSNKQVWVRKYETWKEHKSKARPLCDWPLKELLWWGFKECNKRSRQRLPVLGRLRQLKNCWLYLKMSLKCAKICLHINLLYYVINAIWILFNEGCILKQVRLFDPSEMKSNKKYTFNTFLHRYVTLRGVFKTRLRQCLGCG